MARAVKLTDDEWDDLVAAKTCTIRPTPHTPRLIQLGLLRGGRSRFGNWLNITEAGEKLVMSDLTRTVQSANRELVRQAKAHDAAIRAAPPVASRKAKAPLCVPVASPTPKLENASRAAVTPRRVVSPGSQVKRDLNATASAKRPTPNAVRITIGQRVTYYPLSAFESIKHGEKCKVFTLNKQRYKPLSMAASTGDVVIP